MRGLQIAIDGPAGAGKSTVAKLIARQLGYTYIDTGAMYRAIALAVLRAEVPVSDADAVAAVANRCRITFVPDDQGSEHRILLNGEDVTDEIRSPRISQTVSTIAAIPAVRERLLAVQRSLAAHGNVVMDGRDIGTVVLPQAQVKVFLTASLGERTQRRLKELRRQGYDTDEATLSSEILARDQRDAQRSVAPLKRADDAHLVDTTGKEPEVVVQEILAICQERLRQSARLGRS